MGFEFVDVKHNGRITVVTLNRPGVMNALHKPAHFELHEVFNAFAATPINGWRLSPGQVTALSAPATT